ncbi:FKBP-type peptidyl-prolyl cis-trans isomerase [Pedobacter arcticus]|uniref:FKBP-type peptidyl-prolyl cis-trans isomerase n=1 Tax=Pedobacter arcticus TaxID=752140 RepID=UPI0002F1B2DC|nr:FKBP-type peptidyl-prolyl cis-trans isomerase [Pedobacter arcticus]
MIKKILSLSIIAILALGACKKETRSLQEIEEQNIEAYLKSNNLTDFKKEKATYTNGSSVDTAFYYYKVINPGTGEEVGYPSYVGVSQTTTSINKSVKFEFSKYSPQYNYLGYITPTSWRESLLKIKKGGEVRVITPSYLAYGKTGSGSSLPGNAILDTKLSLVNDVDRVAYEDKLIQEYLVEKNLTATKDANGIYYNIITPGTGTAITSTAASVKVAYTGNLLTGSVFDSATNSSPLTINIASTIEGWRIAVPLIKAGGKIKLYIPSRYGYGATPSNGLPANAILEFEIELIEVTN